MNGSAEVYTPGEASVADQTLYEIEADSLTKRYGSTRALRGVSFAVGRGVTAILGPNGAGKTTLLRILATTIAPTNGSFRVFGISPNSPTNRRLIRRRLGYMPQDSDLQSGMRVDALIDYIALLKEQYGRERHDEVQRVLQHVELLDQARRRIRTLSGGMRRRLLMAQALIGNPPLLILDEPSVGLDPEQRSRFRELISELAATRVVLLSTHQTDDLPGLCDRVLVIQQGALLFSGPPDSLTAFARERVWLEDSRIPDALHAWRTADGRYRILGRSRPSAVPAVEPTLEEGYLALLAGGNDESPN